MFSYLMAFALMGQAPLPNRMNGMEKAIIAAKAEELAESYKTQPNERRRVAVLNGLVQELAGFEWFTPPLSASEREFVEAKADLACEPYDIMQPRTGVYPRGSDGPPQKAWYETEIVGQRVRVWGYKNPDGSVHLITAEQSRQVQSLLTPSAPPPVQFIPQPRPVMNYRPMPAPVPRMRAGGPACPT